MSGVLTGGWSPTRACSGLGCAPAAAGVRYGPPGTKRLVYFVDDMNMPFVDKYDTQSAIELMRQSLDYRGWFDKALPLLLVPPSTCTPQAVVEAADQVAQLLWVVLGQVKIVMKEVGNIQYTACMNPTAGSFSITPRMQRHFATIAVQMPPRDIVRYQALLLLLLL